MMWALIITVYVATSTGTLRDPHPPRQYTDQAACTASAASVLDQPQRPGVQITAICVRAQ
jgi:hypothetical protein